jgi:glycerol uptake facilitator-like aquaporin
VYGCNANQAWYYILAELIGGALAAVLATPLYGVASAFLDLPELAHGFACARVPAASVTLHATHT